MLASALLLTSCGHSSPTRFLTLDPVAPASVSARAYVGPVVRVEAVQVPPALDRPEVVREQAGETLRVSDFDHWGAPLGDLAQKALTQDLAARLPGGSVIFPSLPAPPGSLGLQAEILAISESGGEVFMDVSWRLAVRTGVGADPRHPQPVGPVLTRTLRLTAPSSGDARDHAAAISRLLGELADDVAGAMNAAPG